ncbi:metallophosphoesterase [Agromyces bauzanensis]|uniref:Uncharacterized protein n=1 Tax=Agromyces bauzanensis TaxID=1308924 RepID=A0A917UM75_9MICO|nr:metallophosphoesterase [Agromyces bauzanensis]GGJ68267.1 hypothetical protein GCM10011372_02540 [Agromyces bauzanensis]
MSFHVYRITRSIATVAALGLALASAPLAGQTAALAAPSQTASAEGLEVGVISDLHFGVDEEAPEGGAVDNRLREEHLRNALHFYQERDVDLLVLNGDLVDNGLEGEYERFTRVFNEVFAEPGSAPAVLATGGNHEFRPEYEGDWSVDEVRRLFVEQVNRGAMNAVVNNGSDSVDNVINVGGYTFIGLTTESGIPAGDFREHSTQWLEAQLATAEAADPDKPIFVFVHQPVRNTTLRSANSPAALGPVLAKYPQAIVFAGHTHSPLADERAIHQRDFTSVNTGALWYLSGLEGSFAEVPDRFDAANGLVVDIRPEQVEIERRDFHNSHPIKQDWVIRAPFGDPSTFVYTDERAQQSVAPSFSGNAKLRVVDVQPHHATVEFDAATAADFVYSYALTATDPPTGAIAATLSKPSDFYLDFDEQAKRHQWTISGLTPGREYALAVVATESFGKASAPLTTTIQTPPAETEAEDVLLVDFANGKPDDRSAYKTPAEPFRTVRIAEDSTIGRQAFTTDGRYNTITFDLTERQHAEIANRYTLDVVFKVHATVPVGQVIASNSNTTGIGLFVDGHNELVGRTFVGGRAKDLYLGQIEPGSHYRAVMTYDGDILRAYLNGTEVARSGSQGAAVLGQTNEIPFSIGATPYADALAMYYPLNGSVAYLNLKNLALPGEEIAQDFADVASWATGLPVIPTVIPQLGTPSPAMPVFVSAVNPTDLNRSVQYPQAGGNHLFEYVELYNSSDEAIDLNATYDLLYDSTPLTVTTDGTNTTGVVLPARSAAVLWAKRSPHPEWGDADRLTIDDFRRTYSVPAEVPVYIVQGKDGWARSGGTTLRDKAGTVLSTLRWSTAEASEAGAARFKVPASGTTMDVFQTFGARRPGLVDPQQYNLDGEPPVIGVISQSDVDKKSNAVISAEAIDNLRIAWGRLYYRTAPDEHYVSVDMSIDGDRLTAEIAQAFLESPELQYYIEVSDGWNVASTAETPITVGVGKK